MYVKWGIIYYKLKLKEIILCILVIVVKFCIMVILGLLFDVVIDILKLILEEFCVKYLFNFLNRV